MTFKLYSSSAESEREKIVEYTNRRWQTRLAQSLPKQARQRLASETRGFHYSCREIVTTIMSLRCQFVTYSVPSYLHIDSVQLIGTHFLFSVWHIARPKHIWVK